MSLNKDGSERKAKSSRSSEFFIRHEAELRETIPVFVDRLSKHREEEGYTQKTFAKHIGMSFESYKKVERGDYLEKAAFIIKYYSEQLHVSADYLVGLSDEPHPEYNTVINKTGLSTDSIFSLERIGSIDPNSYDGSDAFDYIDLINAFMGNTDCLSVYIQILYPMIRKLIDHTERKDTLDAKFTTDLCNLYIRYITTVVLPYLSGEKDVDPAILLGLQKDALSSKKKQHNHIDEAEGQ